MNKEQQIEEMAVIGCVRNPQAHTAEECAKCDFKNGQCNSYRHAEALYNAGYRQIDENCAVITKAELKEYKRQAVKEFTQKLKARLAKFIWKHNIPECIFNDVIADLLKEYLK